MIIVKVSYAVGASFLEKNKENIQLFLEDFAALDSDRFLYSVYFSEVQQEFIHLSHYNDEEIQQLILKIPSFVKFQKERDEHLISKPKIEYLNDIGFSKDLL